MTAGQDVVYANSGITKNESKADHLREGLKEKPDGDAAVAKQLHAESHGATPAEQRAFWQHMQIGNGNKSADTHLPKGFTVSGEEGKHVVKDGKTVVYDEAKTAAQAEKDEKIHRGEGPYAAFRRQGMTDAEAKKAAADVKATTGKGNEGFKQNEAFTQDENGQGNWHKKERDEATAKKAAEEKAAKEAVRVAEEKQIADRTADLKKSTDAVKDQTKAAGDVAKGASDLLGKAHGQLNPFVNNWMTKDDVAGFAKDPSGLSDQQKVALKAMQQPGGFEKLAGANKGSDGQPYIDQKSIDAYSQSEATRLAAAQKAVEQQASALARERLAYAMNYRPAS